MHHFLRLVVPWRQVDLLQDYVSIFLSCRLPWCNSLLTGRLQVLLLLDCSLHSGSQCFLAQITEACKDASQAKLLPPFVLEFHAESLLRRETHLGCVKLHILLLNSRVEVVDFAQLLQALRSACRHAHESQRVGSLRDAQRIADRVGDHGQR